MLRDRGFTKCFVEGDLRMVISWAKGMVAWSWKLLHYVREVRNLVAEVKAVVHHVPHSQNVVADKLAK